MTCNHDLTKLVPSLWLACDWVGVFAGYDDKGELDPSQDLAMRNCPTCHSSLCIPMAQERRYQEREEIKVVMEVANA